MAVFVVPTCVPCDPDESELYSARLNDHDEGAPVPVVVFVALSCVLVGATEYVFWNVILLSLYAPIVVKPPDEPALEAICLLVTDKAPLLFVTVTVTRYCCVDTTQPPLFVLVSLTKYQYVPAAV